MQRWCRFLLPCAAAVLVGTMPAVAVPVDDVTIVTIAAGARGAAGAANDPSDPGRIAGGADPDGIGADPYPDMALPSASGAMADLNALIDPASGWEITNAAAVNDAGRIAATACKGGLCYAARLDHVPAVPEPSVLALLGGGLALLGWRRRQAWGFTPLAPRCPG